MKIFLGVGDYKYQQISSLTFFDKIDQLSKSEKIIDLENALDLEYCNIIEVYYNRALSTIRFIQKEILKVFIMEC